MWYNIHLEEGSIKYSKTSIDRMSMLVRDTTKQLLGFLLVCISVNIMNESKEHPKTRTDPVGHLY